MTLIQLRVLLKARLIMITLTYQRLFVPLLRQLERTSGKIVSLFKLMRYITQNLELLPKYLSSSIPPPQIRKAVLRYCTYEKRNRPNFIAEMEAILMRTS